MKAIIMKTASNKNKTTSVAKERRRWQNEATDAEWEEHHKSSDQRSNDQKRNAALGGRGDAARAIRDHGYREAYARQISDYEKNSKDTAMLYGAGSAAAAGFTIGGMHLGQKYRERKGQAEEAELIKKMKRRQMVGQGLGWAAGAALSHLSNRKTYADDSFYDTGKNREDVHRLLGVNALNKLRKHRKIEDALNGGMTGQVAGSLGAELMSIKDKRRLKDLDRSRQ